MPTFNVASFVSETIDSVMKQTYLDWELIIVDDCSSDDTPQVLEEYRQLDKRIIVKLMDVNGGAGVSRNEALKLATGRFFAFLDADDLWVDDKLELQVQHMLANNAAISHTSYSHIDSLGMPIEGGVSVSKRVDLIAHLKSTEIGTSTSMIDTNLVLEKIEFSSIRARQDLKLWIYLLSLGYDSVGLDSPLVKYRVRPNSVSSNKFKMLIVTFFVYWSVSALNPYQRVSCYCHYVINAIKKRQS
ncbi:glycosyltransferase family 2 protein [Vibrio coralliirubri]|uniref:glycosyltransferase family 2 protein n=1 Tax=Vibrio coralliirubri TaxID=1516159 RepID=UPI00063910B1|nr:glycosyltransferase [Vibrio coralliirubri]CDS95259.1 putative teichuronic acid biosynthesis glycosyltransferase tuaG [Vibrio coralliirubri]